MSITLNTLEGRTVCVVLESLESSGTRADWIRQIAHAVLINLAAEIIAVQELTGRPMSGQEVAEWFTHAAEGNA